MSKVKIYYDEKGKSLSVWFDDPKKESLSEEVGDGVILSKDKMGRVIGFEKLYVDFPKKKASSAYPRIIEVPVFSGFGLTA
ncbi:hypothetical protein A3B42_01625 [Candidatus Daviesbacteria bacterium RIFCSPLOWO2_01_FULL_38_10]|uniref:DUF2283 domain-containing protein n=1 Tax=Candidatus Daviesbacteria bacterium GW2011_GWF2_38_6 TaxID=1618432 RepID=A0A0G0KK32_9BACT|nr:MAG: hypothetical protein US80_C0009G0009 [Candidatus Daviesbacteria bacterium GW2011_GWA2_38_17]KKQ79112.1 MAG: hypothetical protein US99_C0002G0009 [Candidatus Daviesbacteria bacterium GW2011_GWF2_38_6]OGE26932.1 MAG: hypothetical protein A3D02_00330 [Candidatus Daviesbacteria bacterium RIFCSPHIGHO2_02_FULL_39_41]OGE29214.1 MAG: hypothetical protein A2772_00265 [Candidatus Daviesbacteria bacterium RIFCSPHIGHO2_01_FULL_38_8b]OGE40373.1 MAG: hypothetical protein A3B42_01625 [Candidatus Davie